MSFTPNKISEKNPITEEVELKTNMIQVNFDLISQETKELNDKINALAVAGDQQIKLSNSTTFRDSFLFC